MNDTDADKVYAMNLYSDLSLGDQRRIFDCISIMFGSTLRSRRCSYVNLVNKDGNSNSNLLLLSIECFLVNYEFTKLREKKMRCPDLMHRISDSTTNIYSRMHRIWHQRISWQNKMGILFSSSAVDRRLNITRMSLRCFRSTRFCVRKSRPLKNQRKRDEPALLQYRWRTQTRTQ